MANCVARANALHILNTEKKYTKNKTNKKHVVSNDHFCAAHVNAIPFRRTAVKTMMTGAPDSNFKSKIPANRVSTHETTQRARQPATYASAIVCMPFLEIRYRYTIWYIIYWCVLYMYICAKIAGASLMKMNHNRKTINRIITGDSEYFCIISFFVFLFWFLTVWSDRLLLRKYALDAFFFVSFPIYFIPFRAPFMQAANQTIQ